MRGECQGLNHSSAADAVAMPRAGGGRTVCEQSALSEEAKKNQLKRLEPKCREIQNGVSFYPDDDRDDDGAGEDEMMMVRRRMVMAMVLMTKVTKATMC